MPGTARSAPGSTAVKRIKKEMIDLAKEDLGDITLTPNEANIFAWIAVLPGPAGSPYEGGMFEVDIKIPEDYPFSPPRLHFITKVYHCNIAPTGSICELKVPLLRRGKANQAGLDLLKGAWSPALSLYKVILSLSSLLTDPNPKDPLVPAIAQEYNSHRKKHDEKAREYVKLYAQPKAIKKPPPPPVAAPRPRAISRPLSAVSVSSTSAQPSTSVTGRRRRGQATISESREPISLVDSDSDEEEADISGIEILCDEPTHGQQMGGGSNGQRAREPARKKARPAADHDDVIIIED